MDEKYYLKEEQTKRLIQNSSYLQDLASEPKINILAHCKNYRRNTQVFDPSGITETIVTGQGGGRGHYTIGVEMNRSEVRGEQYVAKTLLARDYKGFGNHFSNGVVELDELRIRKLSPIEIWRLMKISDEDFYKA